MENETVGTKLPILALRGLVLFPGMTLHFDVGRKASINAVKYALEKNSEIFLVTQRNADDERPVQTGLYPVGTVACVKQAVRVSAPTNTLRVVVEGLYRASLLEISNYTPYYSGTVKPRRDSIVRTSDEKYEEALIRSVKQRFTEYSDISGKIAPDICIKILESSSAGETADLIAGNIYFPIEEKQHILSELNPIRRLEYLTVVLQEEIEIISLEDKIQRNVQDRMDKNQNEYYLREQVKAIYEELGEGENPDEERDKYKQMILKSKMPEDSKEKMLIEADRLAKMSPSSPDANVIRTYLDKCLSLPWGIYTKDNLKLSSVRRSLDRDHYGLKDVKERIVEMLAVRAVAPDIKGQIICLAGPPGVGKTSVAKSIAKAMDRKYVRVALGGVHDEAEIRGHRRTYIGAIPGRIANSLIDAGSANPVMLLDEIDKLSGDFKGDPASALLEVLDAEQNNTYVDHYIDLPFDLSKVLFITTANDKYSIPAPLLDRMEIIDITSYTHEEKFNIAKKHLISKQMKDHNVNKSNLKITDKALRLIIDGYTKEAGVRNLERQIAKLCRKSDLAIADGSDEMITVTEKNIEEYLGPVKFREEETVPADDIGIVNGLAWTSVGGETLPIEVAVLDGTGKTELTGSLGDVMKESAMTAISLIRSRCERYGIDSSFYKNKDIHIHCPEGAVPKDGPSAGITMTTAVLSALADIPVRGNVAMTGEITLRGKVLPIGGLKEKSMAAYRHGMTTVVIPYGNSSDISQIDEEVRKKVKFIPVKTIDEVFDIALKREVKKQKKSVAPPVVNGAGAGRTNAFT